MEGRGREGASGSGSLGRLPPRRWWGHRCQLRLDWVGGAASQLTQGSLASVLDVQTSPQGSATCPGFPEARDLRERRCPPETEVKSFHNLTLEVTSLLLISPGHTGQPDLG